MSDTTTSLKSKMLDKISTINQVDGFDPTPFVVEFNDLITGEVRHRIPVLIQIAWFRLKYPEGRIAVHAEPSNDCFVATARIYPSYKDPEDHFLAEASASRGPDSTKPSISPREWAQTAAVGFALRNAGFGLQFSAAGEDFESDATHELSTRGTPPQESPHVPEPESTPVAAVLTPEEQLTAALATKCPISKYSGKTLGELVNIDPKALVWIANKYTGDEAISTAAKLICEQSMEEASA